MKDLFYFAMSERYGYKIITATFRFRHSSTLRKLCPGLSRIASVARGKRNGAIYVRDWEDACQSGLIQMYRVA